MEVDLVAVAGIIVADVCLTLGVLLLVYHWSKSRKAKAKPVTRGVGAGGRPGGKSTELGGRRGPAEGASGLGRVGSEATASQDGFCRTFTVWPRS